MKLLNVVTYYSETFSGISAGGSSALRITRSDSLFHFLLYYCDGKLREQNRKQFLSTLWHTHCLEVSQSNLVKSWRNFLPNVENILVESAGEEEFSSYDFANLRKSDTGGDDVDEDNIDKLFHYNITDSGFMVNILWMYK